MAKTDIPKSKITGNKAIYNDRSKDDLKSDVDTILSNELELKIKYIDENPEYGPDIDFMSLGGDLSEKNIDSYLPQLLALKISTEKLSYIIEGIIYSNKSNIGVYKRLIELNNEGYNSLILDKIFGNIKKGKDEPWEKELFIKLFKSNPNIDLFFLRNFLKLKLEKSEKQILNARDTIEKILPFLDEEIQNQVKLKYKEYDNYVK